MLTELKVLMLRRRLSQKALAEGMNLSCSQVSRLINERVRVRAHHRRMIASFLRVPQSEIFRVKNAVTEAAQFCGSEFARRGVNNKRMARTQTKQELLDRVAELEQEVEDLQGKLDRIADVTGEYEDMYEPDEEEGEEEEEEEEEEE